MSTPAIATPPERPILFSGAMVRAIIEGRKTQTRRIVKGNALEFIEEHGFSPEYVALPDNYFSRYGYPGDRLYVRETWHPCDSGPVLYAADYGHSKEAAGVERWRPAIHMRRVDARLRLEIVELRVERLQAITDLDARAEGLDLAPAGEAAARFAELWDGINGKRAPWSSNPHVWVVAFRRLEP